MARVRAVECQQLLQPGMLRIGRAEARSRCKYYFTKVARLPLDWAKVKELRFGKS